MAMASDVEIAQGAKLRPIVEIAEELGLGADEIELYGAHKAKVGLDALERGARGNQTASSSSSPP